MAPVMFRVIQHSVRGCVSFVYRTAHFFFLMVETKYEEQPYRSQRDHILGGKEGLLELSDQMLAQNHPTQAEPARLSAWYLKK